MIIIVPTLIFIKKNNSYQKNPLILYNQIGYLPNEKKIFILDLNTKFIPSNSYFQILDENENIKFSASLNYLGKLWGKNYYEGNFSDVTDVGFYKIRVYLNDYTIDSDYFEISDHVYNKAGEYASIFYYYQRCGTEVESILPKYKGHKTCHLDDGLYYNGTSWVYHDLTGGWHDAGDYNKYTEDSYNTQFTLFALTISYQIIPNFWKSLSNKYETSDPDIVDEAVWGARFLQKLIIHDYDDKLKILCGIFSTDRKGNYNRFGYWNIPESETDNIPNTKDERKVGSLWNVSGMIEYINHPYGIEFVDKSAAIMVAAALANTANVMIEYNYWDEKPYSPINLAKNATDLFYTYINDIFYENKSIKENIDVKTAWSTLFAIYSLAKWFNFVGNNSEYINLVEYGEKIRDAFLFESAGNYNLLLQQNTDLHYWDQYNHILSIYLFERLVNGTTSTQFNNFLLSWVENTLLPSCNYTENFFHFMKSKNRYFSYWGTNLLISAASAVSFLAWNLTNNSTDYLWIKEFALENAFHWIMGRNPLDICMIEGLGSKNLPIYHNRLIYLPDNERGEVPGAIPNGIALPSLNKQYISKFENEYDAYESVEDIPYLDLSVPNPTKLNMGDFRTNEVYILNNANFLISFSIINSILQIN